VANALSARRVPYAFAIGYGRESLEAPFKGAAVLAKPFNLQTLESALEAMLAPI
jgi:hypothetical protein